MFCSAAGPVGRDSGRLKALCELVDLCRGKCPISKGILGYTLTATGFSPNYPACNGTPQTLSVAGLETAVREWRLA